MRKALFVSFENSLSPAMGGQQVCTRELHKLLERAGYELTDIPVCNRLSIPQRLINRIRPLAYPERWPAETKTRIAIEAEKKKVSTIFFNLIDFLPLSQLIRPLVDPKVKMVMLSHGLGSADAVHINNIAKTMPEIIKKCPIYQAQELLEKESRLLPTFDFVISISEVEAELCTWLGAQGSSWVPRVVLPGSLPWSPVEGRLGIVGTLDHPPSMEGIVRISQFLQTKRHEQLRVRVVSQSRWHGHWLERKFPWVEFLGPLNEAELEKEASSWCAFLNPIFCFARGCSTKLSTGLQWGLPCITTASGLRGYDLPSEAVVLADGPEQFAEKVLEYSSRVNAKIAKERMEKVRNRFPDWSAVSRKMKELLP